jgi:hypothetical protein
VRNDALRGDEAVTALGNIYRSNNSYSSDNHYCLFSFSIPVENRPLQSITFTSASGAYASIMALSALQNDETAVHNISDEMPKAAQPAAIFDIRGNRLNHMQRGINIVRTTDGRVMKVIRK